MQLNNTVLNAFVDADPNYRDTPVYSGIPPPSLRDVQGQSRYNDQHNRQYNNRQQDDLSRYNPQRQLPSGQRSNSASNRYHPYTTASHDAGSRSGDGRSYQQQRNDPYQQQHYQQQQPHQQQHYPVSSQLQPVTSEAPPHSQPVTTPAAKPAPKLDMRTSTDFIECGGEQGSIQLSLEELCACIQVGTAKVSTSPDDRNRLLTVYLHIGGLRLFVLE